MTKRDFFRTAIKVVGVFYFISIFITQLSWLIGMLTSQFDLFSFIFSVFALGLHLLAFVLMIFKTDFIIDLFKLERGFDDDAFTVSAPNLNTLIAGGIFIFGLYLSVDSLTPALSYFLNLFAADVSSQPGQFLAIIPDFPVFIKTAVGLFFMYRFQKIADKFAVNVNEEIEED
jgi:hypothetical protein